MKNRNFRELLTERQIGANSLVCVGLDPLVEKLPDCIQRSCTSISTAVFLWMKEIVDATAEYASMFKPQRAHWESIDNGGIEALRKLIAHIHLHHHTIPVFLDCKRGDIDRTQRQYGYAHFELDGADGMNYNGYMGSDTLKALIYPSCPGHALVGLGRTSNPGAWEIQDQILADGRRVWELMAERILFWSEQFGVIANAGIVMGAAHKDPADPKKIYSQHLKKGREIYGNKLWNLIPGIGTQEGFIEETISSAFTIPGSVAINSSSGIIFASSGNDFAEAAAREACALRDKIRSAGGSC